MEEMGENEYFIKYKTQQAGSYGGIRTLKEYTTIIVASTGQLAVQKLRDKNSGMSFTIKIDHIHKI